MAVHLGCTPRAEDDPVSASPTPASPAATSSVESSAAAVPAAPRPPLRSPLQAEADLVRLQPPGFGAAVVSVPRGATDRRPIVVGVHGHGVRAEAACRNWRTATHAYPFVLCPHGLPVEASADAPVTWGPPAQMRAEIDAGIAALRARFSTHVAEAPLIYAGFSLGAKNGVEIVRRDAAKYPRVALGEGGYRELSSSVCAELAAGGVRRALLICSTKPCEISYRPVRERLEDAGIEVSLASAGGVVHRFDGDVVEQTRQRWPWLVGDAAEYAAAF
jgi:hypothetical protein